MWLSRSRKKWLAAGVGVVVIGSLVGVAFAGGFTAHTEATGQLKDTAKVNSDRIKFQTKDPTIIRTQTIAINAGASSGWHHHPGVILVTVTSGSVTVESADCTSKTYGPGQPDGSAFVEGGDSPLQVTSNGGATEYATHVTADPPVYRVDDNPPPCAG